MKKILLSFLLLSTISNAQITKQIELNGSYSYFNDSKGSYLLKDGINSPYTVNEIEILKIEDGKSLTISKFVPQQNVHPTPSLIRIMPRLNFNLSRYLFNDDDKLEVLVLIGTGMLNYPASLMVFNEDGKLIKDFGNKFTATILNSDQFVEAFQIFLDENSKSLKLKLYSKINDTTEIYDLGNNTLSIEEFERITNSKVFPNPSNDYINITNPKNGNDIVQIYDVSGRLLKNEKVNPNDDNFRINIQNLSKGNYVIKIGEVSSKFIKN